MIFISFWTKLIRLFNHLNRFFVFIYRYKGKIAMYRQLSAFGIHLFNINFNIYF